jgi:hypothetical protein
VRTVAIVRESGEKMPVALRVGLCEPFVSELDVDVGVEDPFSVDSLSIDDVDDSESDKAWSTPERWVSRAALTFSIAWSLSSAVLKSNRRSLWPSSTSLKRLKRRTLEKTGFTSLMMDIESR